MHITEGIITGYPALLYSGAGVVLVGWAASRMKRFTVEYPEKKPLLGMGGALIFFLSLIPIPAFTGTCSHPCGTPLIAILLGPSIGIGLTGVSLLLQAAFFAHGGFGTWGANVVALGLCGCVLGWGVFRLARKIGLPLWAAGFAGGLAGDLAVYAASGVILSATLATAPTPQYTFKGYLAAIYVAYLPTQLPIALGEMLITGLALQYAYKQRPEVLVELKIVSAPKKPRSRVCGIAGLLIVSGLWLLYPGICASDQDSRRQEPVGGSVATVAAAAAGPIRGMDETVNEHLAQVAGRPARKPLINTEEMGDLWNMLLLLAGGICGFIIGRWWHLLWGKRP